MSRFIFDKPLQIQNDWLDGAPLWKNVNAFGFQLGDATGPVFEVEAGFASDLGTFPPILRLFFNPADARAAPAYLLHDKLNAMTAGRAPGDGVWSSHLAAAVFYEAMALRGVHHLSRRLQFWGVILGIAQTEH